MKLCDMTYRYSASIRMSRNFPGYPIVSIYRYEKSLLGLSPNDIRRTTLFVHVGPLTLMPVVACNK